ncbi:MAG: Rrf2 family transcriptional regulator [Spirochaetota bacterium]|nr:MAG: Rrf2 family transcriptional regulator [Spirochaetota bacterium]
MRLSSKSEYACLALIELAQNYGAGWITIEDISKRQNIPKKYLENILLVLNRAGYLSSRRGVHGGYKLAKDPGTISVAEILRLMDGALAPVHSVSKYFYESTPIERNKNLRDLFANIRDYIANKLEHTTYKDLTR